MRRPARLYDFLISRAVRFQATVMHPYRAPAPSDEGGEASPVSRELVLPFAAVWLVCLARVLRVVWEGAPFGVEDTLALGALVLLPWMVREGALRRRASPRSRGTS